MKVKEIDQSLETCSEAGWFAYDFFLEEPLSESDIFRLKPLGSFLYLSMLKTPFFKIEGDYFHMKGVKGEDHFRVAAHGEYLDFIERVKDFAEN